MQELSPFWFVTTSAAKVLGAFTVLMLAVAYTTLAERRISAWIQDRKGPNRVGPFGLLQPIADGIKNFLKEETMPGDGESRLYFVLGPMISMMPALVTFAVIPFACSAPHAVGVVDMIIADVPIGVLYILALSSLGVYGLVISAAGRQQQQVRLPRRAAGVRPDGQLRGGARPLDHRGADDGRERHAHRDRLAAAAARDLVRLPALARVHPVRHFGASPRRTGCPSTCRRPSPSS